MLQEAKENGTKLLPERATFLPLLDSLVGDNTNLEDVATVQTCVAYLRLAFGALVSGVPPQLEGESLSCLKHILKVSLLLPLD